MRIFTYSEARQRLAELLDLARNEDVVIRRRGGEEFLVKSRPRKGSPLDGPGVKTKATIADILAAIEDGRDWPRR